MRIALFCLTFLFIYCSKKANTSAITAVDTYSFLNKKIESELGSHTEKLFNSSKTYLLAYRLKEATEDFTIYAVFEVSSGALVKKGSYVPGYIQWIDDTSLELLNAPGIVPKGKSLTDYKSIILLKKEN